MESFKSNFDFNKLETLLFALDEDHSGSKLTQIKNELNHFFYKAQCREVLYTVNNDKLFFGMRVYPVIDSDNVIDIISDDKPKAFDKYFLEFDSKLFDPMLGLDEKEITAILLHEIGHIVYDTYGIDAVRRNIDVYFTNTGDYINPRINESYKEVIAYAIKDAVVKSASIFCKFGNEENIADAFVASCGYGPYLESGFRKILRSTSYLNKDVDDRFIVLSWALRLKRDLKLNRLPAIRTLNKAKQLTASELEKREIANAVSKLNRIEDINESAIDNLKSRFNKKINDFKIKGIKSIKNDVFELNLRLRTAEDVDELMYVIRTVNNDIAILQDYLSEPEVSDAERESIYSVLEELYSIRQKAAKEKGVRDKYASIINITYPDMQ